MSRRNPRRSPSRANLRLCRGFEGDLYLVHGQEILRTWPLPNPVESDLLRAARVVAGAEKSAQTTATALGLTLDIDLTPIVSAENPGV